jgi:penicillin-binding protein 2
MYDKRVKIFIILIALFLLVCLFRLAQMQLLTDSSLQDEIARLKLQRGLSRQLKTVRGRILDRNGRILAVDEPQFQLHIDYSFSCFMDERVRKAELLRADMQQKADLAQYNVQEEIEVRSEDLQRTIDKCVYFGPTREDLENRIKTINDKTWNLRTFLAWARNSPNPEILEKYDNRITSVPGPVAIADFQKKYPDENQRLLLISDVDIADVDESWPLLELRTNDDIFTAQLEFLDIQGVRILPKAQRFYPYGPVAAQTIGWVGPAQQADRQIFAYDRLSSYLDDEVCGREDGAEYVCETILRGRRGEVIYDIDRKLVSKTEAQFGKDVSLTLDIELQQIIENYLTDCEHNPNCKAPTAAVVIEVATGDILALVSMPVFDLNYIRQNYEATSSDPNEPLRNRAINKQYPPGSVIKPLILTAGLEAGNITADEVISCPAKKAPKGWPSCWLFNKYSWRGHDDEAAGQGGNCAHNAVKGSCNIYFSRLADRIEPLILQQWLFKFGYGHKIPLCDAIVPEPENGRDLRQAQGQISNVPAKNTISDFEQLPPLEAGERRYFGIGQGNIRVTPLQVANAMAAIAREGLYKAARLFMEAEGSESNNESQATGASGASHEIDLAISQQTLYVVRDGMSAVVNELGGTAYKEFAHSGLAEQGVKVYGKTGSTEAPDNAWFAGFAEDSTGRSIAIAVIVEGGQHGSADAGPLARDIIQFCIDAGYIGQSSGNS